VLYAGALVAFALSRTVGLFGFAERGWDPSPQAAVSVIAEVLTMVFVAASVLSSRQNPITLTALTPGRGCDNSTIVRLPTASISFTDPPESLPLCRLGNAKAGGVIHVPAVVWISSPGRA
jgi:hypothetical protein